MSIIEQPTTDTARVSADARQASPHQRADQVKIPISHTLTSVCGLGPIPWTKIIGTHAMVREPLVVTPTTDSDPQLSQMESATRANTVRGGQTILTSHVRKNIEPKIVTIKALHGDINKIDRQIQAVTKSPIIGIRGEKYTYAGAQERHNQQRAQASRDVDDGSHAHRVKPRHRSGKLAEIAGLCLDWVVFLFALLGILNINLRLLSVGDFPSIIRFAAAVVFATLATGVLALAMRRMGRRHRDYKDASGTIATTPQNKRTIRVEVAALIGLVALAASVMAARIVLDATQAGAHWWLTLPLAAFLAAILGFSAYINYRAEYDDGSPLTDEIAQLSSQLTARDLTIESLHNVRQLTVEQAGVVMAKLARNITTARTQALRHVTDSVSDKAIRIARSYTGNPATTLPDPDLNSEPFDLAQQQATQLAEHQKHLERPDNAFEADLFSLLNNNPQ